ncbi:MAG: glycoside hydrolase family 88 protein [bacterium]
MKRRNFLKKSSLFGAILLPILQLPSKHSNSDNQIPVNSDKLTKVKQAMLSMQRASWEQGVAAQAFLELGDENMVCLMAKEAALRQTEDGRLSVVYVDNGVTDPAASGEAVLFAAQYLEDVDLKKAADKMLEYLLDKAPKTESGILYHTLDKPEIWIDSMYMAPPFLAAAGHFNEALKQIKGVRSYLWNTTYKLFSHRWSDKKKGFVNKNFWGVGNGWAITGMSRVLKKLPSTMKSEKELLIHYIKETLDGCIQHIRPDYLFHNVIDDKATFVETNLSQMVAYTIFRGVADKWLDKSYLIYADNMRKAAHKKVNSFGYVQDVCGAPFFNSPGRATEGQAFFLLMEAAYKDFVEI